MRQELPRVICVIITFIFVPMLTAFAADGDRFDFRLAVDGREGGVVAEDTLTSAGVSTALINAKVLFSRPVLQTVNAAPPAIAPLTEGLTSAISPTSIRTWMRFPRPPGLTTAAARFTVADVTPRSSISRAAACTMPEDIIRTRSQAWEYAYKLIAFQASGCGKLTSKPGDSVYLIEPAEIQLTEWQSQKNPQTNSNGVKESHALMTGDPGPPVCSAQNPGPVAPYSPNPNPNWDKTFEEAAIIWPTPKPKEDTTLFWHRWDEYTGLDSGLDAVRTQERSNMGVLIAHLDTGYPDPTTHPNYPFPSELDVYNSADCYATAALGLPATKNGMGCVRGPACIPPGASESDKASIEKIWAYTHSGGVDQSEHDTLWNDTTFFLTDPYHGSRTLAILAGPFVGSDGVPTPGCHPSNTSHWGANPCAKVIEVRVAPGFLHLNEDSLAAGIRYAVEAKADVISLSHGGLPSGELEDAVDYAYNAGVPIFAASGDFEIPFAPFKFFTSPKSVVFPARYSQVMNVTAAYASSGEPCPFFSCIGTFFKAPGLFANLDDWKVGTNFGPSEIMKNHSIATYTPNITTYGLDLSTPGLSNHEIGTSAAVPQVAGAAAMWLQYRGQDILSQLPSRNWKRTEAVYAALLTSAAAVYKRYPLPRGYTEDQRDEYSADYFGAGLLNVPALLAQPVTIPLPSSRRCHSRDDPFWLVDLFFSLGQAYAVVGIEPDQRSAETDASLSQGLRTEMMQVAAQSESVTRTSIAVTDSMVPSDGTCLAHVQLGPSSKSKIEALNRALQSDEHASPTLKRVIENISRTLK